MDNETTLRLRGGARKGAGRKSVDTERVWTTIPGKLNKKLETDAKRLKITRSALIGQILKERYSFT